MRKLRLPSTRVLSQWAALCLALVAVSACAFGKDDALGGVCASEPAEVTAVRQAGFAPTVYPIFSANGCTGCHDGVSNAAPYAFAGSDPASAYSYARKFSDFNSPASSRFVSKMGEMHQCGSNCSSIADDFETQIGIWAAAEAGLPPLDCSGGNKTRVMTTTVRVSPTDLSTTASKLYRFNLALANPPIQSAGFEISAKLYTAPSAGSFGSYIFSAPKIGFSGALNYHISNIELVINGAESLTATNFLTADFVVAPGSFSFPAAAWAFPLLSETSQLLVFERAQGDDIAFSFDYAETDEPADINTNVASCLQEAKFNTDVAPILAAKCTSCHGGANVTATGLFPMSLGVDLCGQALAKSNTQDPPSSLLHNKPRQLNGLFHPSINPALSTADVNKMNDWISAEAAAGN